MNLHLFLLIYLYSNMGMDGWGEDDRMFRLPKRMSTFFNIRKKDKAYHRLMNNNSKLDEHVKTKKK